MFIEVTQDDINNGVRHSTCDCPIARAATRAFGIPTQVGYVSMCPAGFDAVYIPPVASDFISMFDMGVPVQPFPFETLQEYPLT
jgi:hypothetical protein